MLTLTRIPPTFDTGSDGWGNNEVATSSDAEIIDFQVKLMGLRITAKNVDLVTSARVSDIGGAYGYYECSWSQQSGCSANPPGQMMARLVEWFGLL